MSSEVNRGESVNTRPDAHWYTRSSVREDPPAHELLISPTTAIAETLACLGKDLPAAELRRHLEERGIRVDEAMIEEVRAQLPPAPECHNTHLTK